MNVLIAIDSWKGSLTSQEANEAAREGVLTAWPDAEVLTLNVSDGGEGWLEAIENQAGGERITADVHDPLMRPSQVDFLRKGDTAYIECARVIGLGLLSPEERDPLLATSYGLGELIAAAVKAGCNNIVVGLGGSATSDVGMGMLRAMEKSYTEMWEEERRRVAGTITYTIATDVRNPLFGKEGAAQVFAPQKGATKEAVEVLDRSARLLATRAAREMGIDCSDRPGAGAAGGLGYAFMQFLDARCLSGSDLLLEMAGFHSLLGRADLVITGEGAADRQTLMGKLPYSILEATKRRHLPTWLIAGKVSDKDLLLDAGFSQAVCVHPDGLPLATAMQREVATAHIRTTVQQLCESFHPQNG